MNHTTPTPAPITTPPPSEGGGPYPLPAIPGVAPIPGAIDRPASHPDQTPTPFPACPLCGGSGWLRDQSAPGGRVSCWRCIPYGKGEGEGEGDGFAGMNLAALPELAPASARTWDLVSRPVDPLPLDLADPTDTTDHATAEPAPSEADRAWWAGLLAELSAGDRLIAELDHAIDGGPDDRDWDEMYADKLDPSATWPEAERIACYGHRAYPSVDLT